MSTSLGNTTKNYGSNYGIVSTHLSGPEILSADDLYPNTLIVSSPTLDGETDVLGMQGSHTLFYSGHDGKAARLTYTILPGNGLVVNAYSATAMTRPYSIDTMTLEIDHNSIQTTNQKGQLYVSKPDIIDNYTLMVSKDPNSSNTYIGVVTAHLEKATDTKYGIVKGDNVTISAQNGSLSVITANLDYVDDKFNRSGIVRFNPDTQENMNIRTIEATNGVLRVLTYNLDKANANSLGVIKTDSVTTATNSNGVLRVLTSGLDKATDTNYGIVKPDNSTIEIKKGTSGVLYANAENMTPTYFDNNGNPHFGVIKLNPRMFGIDKFGNTFLKEFDRLITMLNGYADDLANLQRQLDNHENRIAALETQAAAEKIYSLQSTDETYTELTKPVWNESTETVESIEEKKSIQFSINTNCKFKISIKYGYNIATTSVNNAAVVLKSIKLGNGSEIDASELANHNFESTNGKETTIKATFTCNNIETSDNDMFYYVGVTLTATAINDSSIYKCASHMFIVWNKTAFIVPKPEPEPEPEPKEYSIGMTITPANSGTVTGFGDYDEGSSVTINAMPNQHWNFVEWQTNGQQFTTSQTYTIQNLSHNYLLTAIFEQKKYQLIVKPNNVSYGTVDPETELCYANSEQTVSAIPYNGYRFVNWTIDGSAVSTDLNYSFIITKRTVITGNFKKEQYTINVVSENETYGSVSGSGTYEYSETITIRAIPKEGYVFVKWMHNGFDVENELGNSNYSFSVSESTSGNYEAIFSVITKTVTFSRIPTNGGTISIDGEQCTTLPITKTFNYWEQVTVSASENGGFSFINWTDNGSTQITDSKNYTFTVKSDRTLIANFTKNEPNKYIVIVSSDMEGAAIITGAGTYEDNTEQTITITLNPGYSFKKLVRLKKINNEEITINVNDNDNDGLITYTFTISNSIVYDNGKIMFKAYFLKNTYTVETEIDGGGTITGLLNNYNYGDTCSLTAIPNNGNLFTKWKHNGNEFTLPEYSFEVEENNTGDKKVKAFFTKKQFNVTCTPNHENWGTINGSGTYPYGNNCTVNATASIGHKFQRWTKDGDNISTSSEYSFTVIDNVDLVAIFSENICKVNVEIAFEGGETSSNHGCTVSGINPNGYTYNSMCTLYANPGNDYVFVKWVKENIELGTNLTCNYKIQENSTSDNVTIVIKAIFRRKLHSSDTVINEPTFEYGKKKIKFLKPASKTNSNITDTVQQIVSEQEVVTDFIYFVCEREYTKTTTQTTTTSVEGEESQYETTVYATETGTEYLPIYINGEFQYSGVNDRLNVNITMYSRNIETSSNKKDDGTYNWEYENGWESIPPIQNLFSLSTLYNPGSNKEINLVDASGKQYNGNQCNCISMTTNAVQRMQTDLMGKIAFTIGSENLDEWDIEYVENNKTELALYYIIDAQPVAGNIHVTATCSEHTDTPFKIHISKSQYLVPLEEKWSIDINYDLIIDNKYESYKDIPELAENTHDRSNQGSSSGYDAQEYIEHFLSIQLPSSLNGIQLDEAEVLFRYNKNEQTIFTIVTNINGQDITANCTIQKYGNIIPPLTACEAAYYINENDGDNFVSHNTSCPNNIFQSLRITQFETSFEGSGKNMYDITKIIDNYGLWPTNYIEPISPEDPIIDEIVTFGNAKITQLYIEPWNDAYMHMEFTIIPGDQTNIPDGTQIELEFPRCRFYIGQDSHMATDYYETIILSHDGWNKTTGMKVNMNFRNDVPPAPGPSLYEEIFIATDKDNIDTDFVCLDTHSEGYGNFVASNFTQSEVTLYGNSGTMQSCSVSASSPIAQANQYVDSHFSENPDSASSTNLQTTNLQTNYINTDYNVEEQISPIANSMNVNNQLNIAAPILQQITAIQFNFKLKAIYTGASGNTYTAGELGYSGLGFACSLPANSIDRADKYYLVLQKNSTTSGSYYDYCNYNTGFTKTFNDGIVNAYFSGDNIYEDEITSFSSELKNAVATQEQNLETLKSQMSVLTTIMSQIVEVIEELKDSNGESLFSGTTSGKTTSEYIEELFNSFNNYQEELKNNTETDEQDEYYGTGDEDDSSDESQKPHSNSTLSDKL